MIATVWKGLVPYRAALADQLACRERVWAGGRQEVWGLEHPPVVTLGKRGGELLGDAEAAGYDVVPTERGGLATCHEPGQLVIYTIVDARRWGVRRLVEHLEDAVIGWLAGEGVPAGRREGYPGVWVGRDKICAVGLHLRQGVTTHGIALNLVNSLDGFRLIAPCGIADGGVTSVARLRGAAPRPAEAFLPLAASITGRLDP